MVLKTGPTTRDQRRSDDLRMGRELPALPTDRDRSTLSLGAVKAHPEDNVGMGRRGVFLDLNGTLVEPLKPERLDEITLIPGVVEAVARLSAAGFRLPSDYSPELHREGGCSRCQSS
jgi:hypothetical protein